MKSEFQIAKIRAVLLYVLSQFREGVDYIKLFKILYFAQQANLVKYAKPLFDDSFHALKHGPVPSYTYKALQIAEGKALDGDFSSFLDGILVENKLVRAMVTPDSDYLSASDLRTLDAAISKYRDTNSYDLSDLSHDTAWRQAFERSTDDPQKDFMTLIDIARAGNASVETVDYIREKERFKKEFA